MAKKTIKNPNDFEPIVVNGCLIEANTTYEIVPKDPSSTAPPIYRELGSTKERMPGVGNTVSLTQTDTGFFSASNVFNKSNVRNDWTKREALANEYYEIFAAPMKVHIHEIERIKVPTDDEFFNKYYERGYLTVNIEEGKKFNTANPTERFQLYIAIIEGELAMKGKRTPEEKEMGLKDENDVVNSDSQYSYISITERKNKAEQTAEIAMEAAYRYGEILRKDKDLLVQMLSFINAPVKADSTRAELNSVFKVSIEPSRDRLKDFIAILEEYDEDATTLKAKFDLLEKLKTKRGKELVTKQGSSYYFNDVVLGSNLKSAITTLLKPENHELYNQFTFEY